MLLLEPRETPWDLRWQMFGIPVRVHPMFWLLTVIMGRTAFDRGIAFMGVWVVCVFASILIHELGHVVAGLIFGQHGRIVLYAFGGLAVGSNQMSIRWQRILVCFAGPLAGFLFLGLVLAFVWARNPGFFPVYFNYLQRSIGLAVPLDDDFLAALAQVEFPHPLERYAVAQLVFINLLWGLVNLLPVWPLDGGQICRDACEGFSGENGLKGSLGISLLTAGLLSLHCILAHFDRPLLPLPFGSLYAGLFFGLLAWQSFQLLQQFQARERRHREPWEQED